MLDVDIECFVNVPLSVTVWVLFRDHQKVVTDTEPFVCCYYSILTTKYETTTTVPVYYTKFHYPR